MTSLQDKCCKLLQWIYLKVNAEDVESDLLREDYFITEIEDSWYIKKTIVKDLSEGTIYFNLHNVLFGLNHRLCGPTFDSLLRWIEENSPTGRLSYTCSSKSLVDQNLKENSNKSKFYKFVTIEDLTSDPYSNYALISTTQWLKSHLALIETLMRIYMQLNVTKGAMAKSLGLITGNEISENDVKTLTGADGALFWLVAIAARSLTNLCIKNCSQWLKAHVCPGSTNALDESCDEDKETDFLLRKLSLSNLVALLLNFYNPDLASADNLNFNFVDVQTFETCALDNLPIVAEFCSKYFCDSVAHLLYVASFSNGEFNDHGLACASPNARFIAAAVATDLFYWLELRKRFKPSASCYRTYDVKSRPQRMTR
ncbi:Calmodulin-regulated spectrin-associated protein 2 [Cichlidogyrus casuarinus]|uniref:Calmodulin-regulated spectrin-associated protein 2 n=1 Tax=Cichlidogyrus casuarinus TaxID=1844966 RepID=A0ABD2QLW9_9PLAT